MGHSTFNVKNLCQINSQIRPAQRTYAANTIEFSAFFIRLFLCCSLAIAILITNSNAHADEIQIGTPIYGGSGCPQGTADLALMPDGSALGILFDQYVAVAGGETGRLFERKACSLAIPLHIPAGLSVSLVRVDYQGFAEVPAGGQAKFGVEYFFAGSRGKRIERVFEDSNSGFVLSDEVATAIWSECGTDVNLRLNTSMSAITNEDGDLTIGAIGSAEATAGFYYRFIVRSCE